MTKQNAVPMQITFTNLPLLGWFSGFTPASMHRNNFPRGTGPYAVTIRLSGDRFEFDSSDPIWVSVDTGQCPPRNAGVSDIKDVSANGSTLTLTNDNSQAATLRYQLNIVDKNSGAKSAIDPIMSNGGR